MSKTQVSRSKTYCEFETKLLSTLCVLSTAFKELNVNLYLKKKKIQSSREEERVGYLSLIQISSLRLSDFAIDFVLLFSHYNFRDYCYTDKIEVQKQTKKPQPNIELKCTTKIMLFNNLPCLS